MNKQEFCTLGAFQGASKRDCILAFDLCDIDCNGDLTKDEIEDFLKSEANPTVKVVSKEWRHMIMYTLSLTGYSLSLMNFFDPSGNVQKFSSFFIALGGFSFVIANFHLLTMVTNCAPETLQVMKTITERVEVSHEQGIKGMKEEMWSSIPASEVEATSAFVGLVQKLMNYGTFSNLNLQRTSFFSESSNDF